VNLEENQPQDAGNDSQNIKGNVRKVVVFLLVVTGLAAVYQIMIFNYVLPNREIHWQKTSVEQVETFDQQGRRFAVLVLLDQDLGDSTQPLPLFQEPQVREEFNRLRLTTLALPIGGSDAASQTWFKNQAIARLPALMIYASGYSDPIKLDASQLESENLIKTLKDIRFQRYEP
jgi:hypothetical protein